MRDSREKGVGIRDQDPLATARKIIDAACSIQAGRFLVVEISNAKSTSPALLLVGEGKGGGEKRGLLSQTAAGNRAYPNFKLCNPITLYLPNRSYPYYRHDLHFKICQHGFADTEPLREFCLVLCFVQKSP